MAITDWDAAYQNDAHIKGAAAMSTYGKRRPGSFVNAMAQDRCKIGVAYGPDPSEAFDLFLPEATPKGLFVFIHGGDWRANSRHMWSHLAGGGGLQPVPGVTIADTTGQIARAVSVASGMVAGPIHLSGDSTGGHLAARMACRDVDLAVSARIARVVSISGPCCTLR